jgi:hypothetical protein
MVLTVSFVLSPVIGYRIHTFGSRRVVPYLMRRKSSRPKRITVEDLQIKGHDLLERAVLVEVARQRASFMCWQESAE